jgi:hypothetical protein
MRRALSGNSVPFYVERVLAFGYISHPAIPSDGCVVGGRSDAVRPVIEIHDGIVDWHLVFVHGIDNAIGGRGGACQQHENQHQNYQYVSMIHIYNSTILVYKDFLILL